MNNLIVLEGPDGSGVSTQARMLKKSLEKEGYGVHISSPEDIPHINVPLKAMENSHSLNPMTHILLQATNLARRVKIKIQPFLDSGHIVICDRFAYSHMINGIVKGVDEIWADGIFSFALDIPHKTYYLTLDIDTLIERCITKDKLINNYKLTPNGNSMDYWKTGLDMYSNLDIFGAFRGHQRRMIRYYRNFQLMDKESVEIDARQSSLTTHEILIKEVLSYINQEDNQEDLLHILNELNIN